MIKISGCPMGGLYRCHVTCANQSGAGVVLPDASNERSAKRAVIRPHRDEGQALLEDDGDCSCMGDGSLSVNVIYCSYCRILIY